VSVQLLSSLDSPDSRTDSVAQEPAAPVEKPETGSGFEKHLESAWSQIEGQYKEPERKPLDEALNDGLKDYEKAVAEREAFDRAAETRQTFKERYKQHGADTKKTLGALIGWHDLFKTNPHLAGQKFAKSYLAFSGLEPEASKPKEKPQAYIDPMTGNRDSGKVLEHIIQNAQESAEEGDEYEITKEERAKLNEIFPGVPFDVQMQRLLEIDNRARKDPLATAAQLAASYGMPVFPSEIEAQQVYQVERAHAEQLVAQAAQQLPDFERYRHHMAHLVKTGQADNIRDAYQLAVHQTHNKSQFDHYAIAQLNELAKSDDALARSVVDIHHGKDPAFEKIVAGVRDPVSRFQAAIGYARSKAQQAKAAVSKATRALPVKSSSGASPSPGRSGIDGAIRSAMAQYKD
jgi:hypothetical protein